MITAKQIVNCCAIMLRDWGMKPLVEYRLPNGRRLDVAAIGATGRLLGIEVKISESDFNRDLKWADCMRQCFIFYFAVPVGFRHEIIHPGIRLIHCDGSRAWISRHTGNGLIQPHEWHRPSGTFAVNPTAGVGPAGEAPPGDSSAARPWMP